jgi:hypothetical protein
MIRRALLFSCMICALLVGTAQAQDDDATPTPTATPTPAASPADPRQQRIDEMTKQIELLTKRKELVDAQKNLVTSYIPTPKTAALSGDATVSDNATLESELMAYQSMSVIAREIGSKVRNKARNVVIYNANDSRAIQFYSTVKSQLVQLEQGYKDYLREPDTQNAEAIPALTALMAPQAAASVLGSVADLIAMFNTNVDIKGASFTFEEVSLVSQLIPELSGTGRRVVYPSLYTPDMLSEVVTDIPEILTLFSNVFKQKATAEDIVAAYEAKEEADKLKDPYRHRIARLKALNEAFAAYVATLSALDNESGTTPMASLIKAEKLTKILVQPDAAMLYVKVLRAGGNNRITKNLFKGTKITHSGGTVVSYILFDNTGAAVLANTLYNYDGYKRFKSKYGKLTNNLSNVESSEPAAGGDK